MGVWLDRLGPPGGGPEPPGSTAPLSFAQEEMWHHYLLDPNDPIYNEYDAILIEGPLDRTALEWAMQRVAERHDAFHIRFTDSRLQPVMVHQERSSFPLRFVDAAQGCASVAGHTDVPGATASADPQPQTEASIDDWVRRIVREPIDLRAEPARATLVRLGPDRFLYVIVMHHIIKDGTSESILMRDLSHYYAAYGGAESGELPAIETSLAGYARWQRRLEAAGAFKENLDWWARELRGVRPADVPGDFARPAVLSSAGAKAYHTIAPPTVESLRALARAEGASLYMILSAAYALLLRRYSGSNDVPIAFPAHNRMERTANVAGCFIHSLVFRPRFEGSESFRDLLRRSRDILAEAYRRQDVHFTQVAGLIETVRRADQNAIAATSLLMRNPKWEKLRLPGCTTRRFDVDVGIAKLDLVLELEEFSHGLFCKLEYRSSLYTPQTATALLENFDALLSSVAADPDESIRTIDVRSVGERAALQRWETGSSVEVEETVIDGFTAQARLRPDRPALIDGDRTVTYAQLEALSATIARSLAALMAAGPHPLPREAAQPIAICARRSIEAIASMLGVMRSGAPYLALDPGYPAERLRFMLEDAGASLVLTTRDTICELPPNVTVRFIEDLAATPDPSQLAASGASPSHATSLAARTRTPSTSSAEGLPHLPDAAYVMYTSGSTGRPNGVVVEHSSLANYIDAFRKRLALDERDRLLQFASLGFDISLEEIFGALCSGASLTIAPHGIANSVVALLAECAAREITVLDLPTVYFHVLAEELTEDGHLTLPSGIRTVVVGGEPLRTQAASRFFASAGAQVRLLNTYGPTETTVAVTMLEIDPRSLASEAALLPVGGPIQNVSLAILDDALQPVPAGAVGQLFLAGAALARGYLGRPELSAKRFIEVEGRRLYATGDLARFRRDGTLELHGRFDDQVKIHGFRVEPGEIETALHADASIRAAAVVPVDGELVACVVGSVPLDVAALRARMMKRLPAWLVPHRFMPITELPLTPNGKRDRAALMRAAANGVPARHRSTPPSGGNDRAREQLTPMQARLQAIWEEFFGRPVGLHDDFFALGGHSLLAARIFARIEAKMGRRLPLQQLFVRPTVAGIAEALVDERLHVSSFVSIHESQRRGKPIFYLHGDNSGGALYTRALARRLRLDRPLCVLAPHGGAGEPLPPSIDVIVEDYLAMIKAIQPRGPYLIGGHCMGGLIAIELARRLRESGERVERVFAVQPPSPQYALAGVVALIHRLAQSIRIAPERTLALTVFLKQAWRFIDRIGDPKRRGRTFREVTDRLLGPYGLLRFLGRAPMPQAEGAWHATLTGMQSRLADRFNPEHFDGKLLVIRGRESLHELAEHYGWGRAATDVRVVETDGDHSTCFTQHQEALAELLSRELAEDWAARPARSLRRIAAAL